MGSLRGRGRVVMRRGERRRFKSLIKSMPGFGTGVRPVGVMRKLRSHVRRCLRIGSLRYDLCGTQAAESKDLYC